MYIKKLKNAAAVLLAALLLFSAAGCASGSEKAGGRQDSAQNVPSQTADSAPAPVSEPEALEDPEDEAKVSTGEFTITAADASSLPEAEGPVFTVKQAGEYTLSGSLDGGQIIVDAGDDDEVVLILSNLSVTCADDAPVLILNAGEVTIKSEEGSYNTVTDERSGEPASDDENDHNAAVWSACDLKLTGKGTLIVTSGYDNGVKSKDDVSVKNVTLKITSPGAALKGNDSVTIKSGELILISTEGDGLKTSNSDVSSKGNQRGTVSILGGHVDIYAACDGISAAYDVEISPEEAGCTVNIFTASYADASQDASSVIYLLVPSHLYSDGTGYWICFYDEDPSEGVWAECEYETMAYGGRNSSYYALAAKMPDGRSSLLVNTVEGGQAPDGSNYSASSGGGAVNRNMNAYLITDISDGVISADWVSLSSSGSDKTAYSSKGIKADNSITVTGGTVSVSSGDDELHANSGVELENGYTSVGSITVSGGSVTVISADDGMHADGELTISGGYVDISESHEGLEANVVTISGGEVHVYGDDDGVNATGGSVDPLVNITGGYLEVATPSGDTDAIDSNGSMTLSGGFVLVRGGSSQGGMAGSVDVDRTVTVTGGTIVALGGVCQTPSGDSVNTYISNGTSFSAGTYVLFDSSGREAFSFSLNGSYSSCWIASESISLGESYTLTRDGTQVLSWTQSSQSEGGVGGWGGGFPGGGFPGGGPGGGPGGNPFGGRR